MVLGVIDVPPAWGFPGGLDSKESACNAEDPDSIPGSGRSLGEGNGYPLQCSGLENSVDCRVAKSQTLLSDFYILLTSIHDY